MRNVALALVVLALAAPVALAQIGETTPVPPGQLTPGKVVLGPNAVETYGSTASPWSGTPRERGNLFAVTTSVNVTQMEWYINPSAAETFYFSIYRKTNDGTVTGTYDRVFITSVPIATAGDQWIGSGTMSYTLDPAYYYYLSVAWDTVSCVYYRSAELTPIATGFGQLLTGIPDGSGHPATWTNTWASGSFSPYHQRLTFDAVPVELMTLSVE
ncbi:MAG: hypothetical protein HY825_09450 [Acidobacteria bacterium]|nr:hypothetical protein [Acidobacteriota bacterium]